MVVCVLGRAWYARTRDGREIILLSCLATLNLLSRLEELKFKMILTIILIVFYHSCLLNWSISLK